MTGPIKRLIKPWVPPALIDLLRKPSHPPVAFASEYPNWALAKAEAGGYDDLAILDKVKAATLKVIRGEAAQERDSVTFDRIDIAWPVLSGLLWAATRNDGVLRVLDFGGSLGTTYRQNKSFLQSPLDVRWGVVEQRHYVACGREITEDRRLEFFETIDECVATLQPNVIMLGAVLQYLESPYAILEQLANTTADVMIIDRTPFFEGGEDRIAIQIVPPSIYLASYPSWLFSPTRFHSRVPKGWAIVTEFDSADAPTETASGLPVDFRGMILSR